LKTAQGPAIAGGQIWVCTQPANISNEPTPLALIYSDPNGLVPITQPIITDGLGHYDFYVLPGLYTVVVSYGGMVQQFYPDQSLGGIGTGAGGTALLLEVNGSPNGSQTLLNLTGAGSATVTDSGTGTVTISNTGVAAFGSTYIGTLTPGSSIILHVPVGSSLSPLALPTNLAGSAAHLVTAPTSTVTILLLKNGTQFGTITFAAGQNYGTFSSTAQVLNSPTDYFTVQLPSSVDATAANLGITIVGNVG
jgi:hypothetical protein